VSCTLVINPSAANYRLFSVSVSNISNILFECSLEKLCFNLLQFLSTQNSGIHTLFYGTLGVLGPFPLPWNLQM